MILNFNAIEKCKKLKVVINLFAYKYITKY